MVNLVRQDRGQKSQHDRANERNNVESQPGHRQRRDHALRTAARGSLPSPGQSDGLQDRARSSRSERAEGRAPCPSVACAAVYRPRRPRDSPLYRLVERYYERVKGLWEERFERRYGYWRGFLDAVVYSFLDCGDLHRGFARVCCGTCGTEFLVAFSCQRPGLCPSCGAKRALLTLLVVPVTYTWFDDLRQWVGAAIRRAPGRRTSEAVRPAEV